MKYLLLYFLIMSTCLNSSTQIKDWNLLFYLSGDNNLSYYMNSVLNQLKSEGAGPNVNVLILFDGNKENDSLLIKLNEDNRPTIIEQNIEYDMGNVSNISKLINLSNKKFPAKHTALIINGHGLGVLNPEIYLPDDVSVKTKIRTLLSSPDDNSENFLTEESISHEALKANNNKKIDLMIYDSCLMGNFEVAMTLAPAFDFLVASEYPISIDDESSLDSGKLVGVSGKLLINYINDNNYVSPNSLGNKAIDLFKRSYDQIKMYSFKYDRDFTFKATMSLFNLKVAGDTEKLLAKAIKDILLLAKNNTTFYYDLYLAYHTLPLVNEENGYVDMLSLLKAIYKISALKSVHEVLNKIENELIIKKTILNFPTWSNPSGISIFFPFPFVDTISDREYDDYYKKIISNYSGLSTTVKTSWLSFINSFSASIKNSHFTIYSGLVKKAIIENELIIVLEDHNAKDQLRSLFNLTEVSMYPLLDEHNYDIIIKYVSMIMSSTNDSIYLVKHRRDLKRLFLDELKVLKDKKNITAVNKILFLLKDISSELMVL